jgi:hypothetical protein
MVQLLTKVELVVELPEHVIDVFSLANAAEDIEVRTNDERLQPMVIQVLRVDAVSVLGTARSELEKSKRQRLEEITRPRRTVGQHVSATD